jgi:hypothetical protein
MMLTIENAAATIGRVNDFDSPRVSAHAQAPIPVLFTLEKNLTHRNFNGSTSAHTAPHKKSIGVAENRLYTKR